MRQGSSQREGVDEPGDRSVVERVLAGDRDSYRVLVRRYQAILYRHALRMTREYDVAADLVQASFIKAYAGLARCRDRDRFGAWLFRILANSCKDYLKSRRRKDVSLDYAAVHPEAPSNPHSDLERREIRDRLEAALGQLPETLREAFVLKHLEGLSYEEIAALMNSSVPALKMRVHRAREVLKDLMAEKE